MRCYSTATATNPTSSAAQEDKKVNSDQKAEPSKKPQPLNLSRRERLNLVIKDYGKTVIFFHIGISLISLGGFYTMVSRFVLFDTLNRKNYEFSCDSFAFRKSDPAVDDLVLLSIYNFYEVVTLLKYKIFIL